MYFWALHGKMWGQIGCCLAEALFYKAVDKIINQKLQNIFNGHTIPENCVNSSSDFIFKSAYILENKNGTTLIHVAWKRRGTGN